MSETITLTVDGGPMDAYVSRPVGGTGPGIMVFQEAFGVNAHIRDVTDRFAKLGFTAIAPELFHRTAPRGFEAGYTDYALVQPHTSVLTREGLQADLDATYEWLSNDSHVDKRRIAAIGFCLGGRASFIANAREQLAAAVSFYGGGIDPALLDLAEEQRAPILMFWGGLDGHILPANYRAVADALSAAKKIHEQVVFHQADHGFFCDARAAYNEQAARQAWALTQEFFRAYGIL